MLKSLFGGSVALAAALLLSSLSFYAQTTNADRKSPATQNSQTQIKADSKAVTPAQEAEPDTPSDIKSSDLGNENGGFALAPPQKFTATAYALRGRTASGHTVRRGLIAAGHSLPLGTRVRIDAGSYSGFYTVADRGSRVRGRTIDIWVPSNSEAMRFGRRPVKLTILNYSAKRAKRVGKAR